MTEDERIARIEGRMGFRGVQATPEAVLEIKRLLEDASGSAPRPGSELGRVPDAATPPPSFPIAVRLVFRALAPPSASDPDEF